MSTAKPASAVEPAFEATGFFALRTPLLPFDELLSWAEGVASPGAPSEETLAADRQKLRARLQEVVARPEVREALFIASPSLDESLDLWLRDPEGVRGQKVERTLVRYFARMAGRPTPFGLFAGCSVGVLGEDTRLAVAERGTYRRHTRLDSDYLMALTEALGADPSCRRALTYRPNTSLYRAAGRLRYAERRLGGTKRSYHLVAVEPTDYLEVTLARARDGARMEDLAAGLVSEEISIDDATKFVTELIGRQLIVSELAPNVTGPEPIHGLIEQLRPEVTPVAQRLEDVSRTMSALDSLPLGAAPSQYRAIAAQLEGLPTKVDLSRLFQVDMVKPAPEATLGPEPLREIIRGVELGYRLSGRQDIFSHFRDSFNLRYEGRELPLVEVLDEEMGIGFGRAGTPSAEGSPLLDGLSFPEVAGEDQVTWGARDALLLSKLEGVLRSGTQELVLESEDLKEMTPDDPLPLPDAFAAMATLAASSDAALVAGDFRVHVHTTSGPSGANLLGRFCHGDPALLAWVERQLRAEEARRPEAMFAEVVHLPEGRIGNLLLRPLLREHEISYLGRSGAPRDKQITVDDLLISVDVSRIVLRSARLGREVIPRLTTAHGFSSPRNLGVYRFLCALQYQGIAAAIGWSWGALETSSFLPRVVVGRLVLSLARWRLDRTRINAVAETTGWERIRAVRTMRRELKLPRLVGVADGDSILPVDFDNALSIDAFVHLVKDRSQVTLQEIWPGPSELCAHGPEGRFVHELVVPFLRRQESVSARPPRVPTSVTRTFFPGSEWLYAKLYTSPATADRVLREALAPVVERALASGAADGWFFIRYADPDWHLRLRFHGHPERLRVEVLPLIHAAMASLLDGGLVWRMQLETYAREVERYGGEEGMRLSERLFQADSEAALAIVSTLSGDEGADARWRLALRAIDLLLVDLGLDLTARHAVLTDARYSFGAEFHVETSFKKQLGDRFRRERHNLEALMEPPQKENHPLARGLAILRARSERIRPLAAELLALAKGGRLSVPLGELASSYIHMCANRLLRSAMRAQELVIYDFLERLYQSQVARPR